MFHFLLSFFPEEIHAFLPSYSKSTRKKSQRDKSNCSYHFLLRAKREKIESPLLAAAAIVQPVVAAARCCFLLLLRTMKYNNERWLLPRPLARAVPRRKKGPAGKIPLLDRRGISAAPTSGEGMGGQADRTERSPRMKGTLKEKAPLKWEGLQSGGREKGSTRKKEDPFI